MDLLTVPEVAAMLRVSTWTVRNEIKAKRLRATKVGRHWRIREDWVIAYADAQATGPEVEHAEAVRGWVGVPAGPGREVGRDLGGDEPRGPQAPVGRRAHVRGRDPQDASRAEVRGVIELEVAAADRKRRRVPRAMAS